MNNSDKQNDELNGVNANGADETDKNSDIIVKNGDSETASADKSETSSDPQTEITFRVIKQYIRDLSLENPNARHFVSKSGQPQIDLNVDVAAQAAGEGVYEVTLKVDSKAQLDDKVMFAIELSYSALFRIEGVPREQLSPFILIECPRLMFPYARNIVADTTRDAGYPPLMLDPIDFAMLYRNSIARQAAEQKQAADEPAGENGSVD